MPTPESYNTRREEDYSPRVSAEHANTVPEKQLVELIGEMFNNCMDNFMASRDVRPAKSEPNVSFSEVPLEYRDDPDRRVDTESVVVVLNLPKHGDENFTRTATLGCGEITKVLTSDLGANVGAQISFKNNDGTVKACNQLNQTVINNDRLNPCIMNIPSSHKQEPSTPAQTRSRHHNRVGSLHTPSNKSQCRLRGVTPISTRTAPSLHQNSPARSEYCQPPV